MKDLWKKTSDKAIGILSGVLILVTLGIVWLVNDGVPFMMDDIWYSEKLISNEASGIPITSFKDIIESQIWHYYNWGGRSITHGLLQILLQLGEKVVDVLNVIAVIVLAYVMYMMASISKSSEVSQAKRYGRIAWLTMGTFCAMAMMIGLNANWKMSMFWQAGAVNYLYITTFILLFLYCFLRENPDRRLYGITLWIIPLGIIAGWSNENMGPTAWILSLLIILMRIYQKNKVYLWMILGNAASLAGSVLVIIAPGNFVRSEQAGNEYGLLWNLFLRCYSESKAALEYLFPTIFLLAVALVIGKGILNIEIGARNHLLMLGALLSWGAMVLSPHYPDRATFGTMILMICVIMSMIQKIGEKEKKYAWLMFGLTVLIWLRGMFFLGEYMAILWGWIK